VSTRRATFVADSDAWGGAEVYLTHLLRRAEGLGWSASLVCAAPVAGRLTHCLPAARSAVVPLARHAADAPVVRAAVAAQRPDGVVVNLVDPASNAAALAAGLATAPTVGVLHLDGDTSAGPGRPQLAALYGQLSAVLTPAAEARIRLTTDLGVPGDRVHVVHNGVDIPAEPAGAAGGAVLRVGGLGRLTAQKGFDVLIDAVRRVVSAGQAVDVVIGGDGRDRKSLRAAAAGLPVTFAGFVSDTRRFLAGLDIFCLPSRREALPLVLLEAMAEGLPCIASDVGDVRAAAGIDALVVPPGDAEGLAAALTALLTDPVLRRELGGRARHRAVRDFDADLMARRTFAVLDRVVAPGHGHVD
jgi:glycosyltransferase involved in cell wall biosynthesis